MKKIEEFLSYLNDLDVKLWVETDRLRCNAPKETLTPALRAELAERKAEILTFLHKANLLARFSTLKPIESVPQDGYLPLSFAQTRLWFLDQLEGPNATYNIPAAVRLIGSLQVAALEQALAEIVWRHEILRTTFLTVDGSPVQAIASTQTLTLPLVDLQTLPDSEQSAVVQRLATSEQARPFDLVSGPLLRVTLLRLGSQSHVLLLTMHHIISDGWSMGIFIRELAALYKAFSKGAPSPLPELPIQYADFAVWQRQWLSGEVLETQLNYWKQQLAGAPQVLQLPTDRPRPPLQTFRGGSEQLQLNAELTSKLVTLSQQSGATLYMTLLGAFVTLLCRLCDQHDIVVGSPIANRNCRQTEPIIGFFVNTLVLRTDVSGNPSFSELLQRVRQVALDAYAHQDLPFEQLVEVLQPERSLSHTPLFQVMFVMQNAPMGKLELPGITLTPLELESVTAKFDLTLSMSESESGLVGCWEYNRDLFEAATITRMAGHFQTLLEGIVANPQQHLAELPLLSAAERHQILVEWNSTQSEYPLDLCIHQLFEEQVERTPDSVAVVFEEQQLTYRELNGRANQLAHYLRTMGVGPDVLVGICVTRSLSMVVGLLGILKAGGAYVPLDPAYPSERLAFMLEDASVPVLLVQQHLVSRLPEHRAHVVYLDGEWQSIAQETEENPSSGVAAQNLAYVIYTSGSTGKPKGVAVPHLAVNRLVCNTNYVKLDPADKIAQASNTSFDAATFEIWGALLHGAQLVGISKDITPSPHDLALQLREKGISVLFLTTALFQQVARVVPQAFDSLRYLLFGGEVVEPRWVQQVLKKGAPKQLLHVYGPTESTTFASCYWVQDVAEEATSIPIGRPITNTQIYLLDRQLQPVPIGVAGELYIGGDGLACGYLNRPELTAQAFIANPFSDEPGARLYKTGDLARYRRDGNIEFLGRIDNQVKIRGMRIELGEIEAVVSTHPDVLQSVVMAREDIPGDKRLVAYLVPNQEEATCGAGVSPVERTGVDLRRFLKELLPDYMVPSAFVILPEKLPLTPNGKVDHRLLPVPDTSHRSLEAGFVPPRTPTEEVLAGIWAEVLRVEVGIHDNFFELGGHSLLATQVISRVREVFCVELPLRCLFESPTVAELGEAISATRYQNSRHKVPAILPVPREVELPLSFAQARLWFLDQLEGKSATYNMPAAVLLRGLLNVHALEQAVTEIVRRHEVLRTTFPMVNGSVVQVIAPTQSVTLPIVGLQGLPEVEQSAEVLRLATEEAQGLFDLSNGPLVRVTLLWLDKESHVLLLTMHHIVSDGWSMGIFIRELATLYKAFSKGASSPLPELPIQYADFAVWQRQWLTGKVLETQLHYWQQQLAGAPPVLALPTDQPRPKVQTFRGKNLNFKLNRELTQKLKRLSQQSGATLFMTLLAAFATLLSRYSGQEDIVVGSPIANRNRTELEGLIGFFANTVALRIEVSGNPTFRELLGRVREVTMGAYVHQDLPFEKLVEALQLERALSRNPLVQVVFALQNAPSPPLELLGLSLSPLESTSGTVRFDLEVHLWEAADGLSGYFVYSTELYDAATITRMAGHFQTLLEGIVANSEQRLSELPLLTEAERQQLLLSSKAVQADPDQKNEEQILAQLGGLSDEEVNALIKQMLAE